MCGWRLPMDLKMAKSHQQYLANHGAYTKIVECPLLEKDDNYILEGCTEKEYRKDIIKHTFSVVQGGKSE